MSKLSDKAKAKPKKAVLKKKPVFVCAKCNGTSKTCKCKATLPKETKQVIQVQEIKPVKSITVIKTKQVFPLLKSSDIFTDQGIMTRKGTVYLFWHCNKHKVIEPIRKFLKESIKDQKLYTPFFDSFIDNQFDKVCIRAFEESMKPESKMTREMLVSAIQKSMEMVKQVLFANLSLLDI